MKKVISLLLALSMLFVLCACSPDIKELTAQADDFVTSNYPYADTYSVTGSYVPDTEILGDINGVKVYDVYFVVVKTDEALLNGTGYSKNSAEGKAGLVLMTDPDEVDELMEYLFENVQKIFKRTDVEVVVSYQDPNGKYTKTLSTIN